jgi:LuxR family maltose regulon positive regulatory protein
LHVRRPRLLHLLDAADERQLILVSAPAGYGKTSLVADWITSSGSDEQTAWVTFEAHDEGFWPGLVGCLESLGVEASAGTFRHAGPGVDPRILTSLASSVAGHDERVRVVIDGYDLVSSSVGRDLDFLLRHSGHRLQLVLLTRSDPLLPLYRYRLEDNIAELRMRDLAFTDQEAAELFASAGVELQASSIQALNTRAAGWAVGLRFASAMLREREDTDAAVAEVVGDTGNIAEYLVAEVLDVQTPQIRRLLLSTSITDTVCPGLDEALGGGSAARNLLLLARDQAFVEPVPGHVGSYRYHPFFRDLLRATLSYEDPRELERLHRVAAEWFAEHGQVEESVGQLLAIRDWDEAAARVVVDQCLGELLLGSSGPLRAGLSDLPRTTTGAMVPLVRSALSLVRGETVESGRELVRARDAIESQADHDEDAEVALAVLEALHGRNHDAVVARDLAGRAAAALPSPVGPRADPDPSLVGLVGSSRGIAAIRMGDLTAAEEAFTEVTRAAVTPELLPASESEGFLALLDCFRGRLSHAVELASHALAAAEHLGVPAEERPSAASLALAWVAVERCDLPAAIGHAAQAERSHFLGGDPVTRATLAMIRSRIEAARGHLPGALSIVQAAIALAPPDEWTTAGLHLEAARVALAAGKHALAQEHLAGASGAGAEAVLQGLRQDLARGRAADVDGAQVVLQAALALHVQVDGLLTLASAQLHIGSPGRARVSVDRALRLAAGENLRRPFHDAAPDVRQLLLHDAGLLARHQWLGQGGRSPVVDRRKAAALDAALDGAAPVLEELTPRELEVLGHLAELLSTEEIAETMFVSVNTVRTHVRSILRKLDVPRRNAAVRRARELRLIAS